VVSPGKTLRLKVDPGDLASEESAAALNRAAAILRSGGTVAFPTETVYGLGANALDGEAVARIFAAKARPSWDPLIVHVATEAQLESVTGQLPAKARPLMDAFWPGPLTLLLPKSVLLPSIVTAGRSRVGVRMPSHPVARRLIELAEVPIAAPSANSFGRTSPTRAEFVLEDLDGRIDAVIDAGETTLGLESTVVDVCDDPPVLYRPGMVTSEELEAIIGTIVRYAEAEGIARVLEAQPSPGVGLKHYSPRARLILFEFDGVDDERDPWQAAQRLRDRGEVVGIMLPERSHVPGLRVAERSRYPPDCLIYPWGQWADSRELARRLFAGLRELDKGGATVILCPLPPEEGLGQAIRDRLLKAAR
jgi:L-threonylcarbamoyladenylate synthase